MSDNRKDLPPASAPNFLEKVREAMGTYLGNRGDKLDRGVTLRDLVDSNIITLRPGFLTGGGGGGSSPVAGSGTAVAVAYETDLTPPPTPSGMTLSAAISNIFIGHAAPTYTQGHGHARTIVYGATWAGAPALLPTFADAVKITEFTGTTFAHPSNPATTWHVWIKWQSVDGVLSTAPAGGTNGLVTTTGQDVATLLTALTGQLKESQLFNTLGARIDLVDGASGLAGSVNARVLTETNARATAILAETTARGTAIANEATTRADAILAEASARGTAINTANTLRADGDTQVAATVTTLTATVTANDTRLTTAVQTEATARATADTTEAGLRTTLAARVTTAEGAITGNAATSASAITAEQTARANADSANASSIGTLSAQVNHSTTGLPAAQAAIVAEQTARANGDSAEAAARTTIVSTLRTEIGQGDTATQSAAQAYVDTNFYTKTNRDSAVAAQNSTLRSEFATADANTLSSAQNYTYSKATIDSANTTQTNTITSAYQAADTATLSSSQAYVQGYAYTKAQADSAAAGQVAVVAARLNSGGDTFVAVATAQTTASAKSANFVQTTAPTATKISDLWIDSANGNVLMRWTGSAWVPTDDTRIGSTASSLTTLSSQVNNASTGLPAAHAAVQTETTTRATQTGNLFAQYTVKVDVNGYVSGYGLASTVVNGTPSSEFMIRADNFAIAPVNTDNTAADGSPFFYRTTATTINGVSVPAGAYMKAAFIHDATITNAKIANLAVDNAKIADLSVSKLTAGAISTGDITSTGTTVVNGTAVPSWSINGSTGLASFNNVTVRGAVFANAGLIGGNTIDASGLQSPNYVAGSAGWRINSGGAVEFGSGVFRGSLSGATITGVTGTFSGSLSGANITGATGTFSGNLAAGTVDFASSVGTTASYTQGSRVITVPANMFSMRVVLIGGGGGGGAGQKQNSSSEGGGGGAGGLRLAVFNGLTPGAQYTLVVGGAGVGGLMGNGNFGTNVPGNPGTAGQDTYIAGVTSAGGGQGGGGAYPDSQFRGGDGGAGGSGTTVGQAGINGANGNDWAGNSTVASGGSVPGYGTGGTKNWVSATPGSGYGAGGAGGNLHVSGYDYDTRGAAGAPGFAVIEFYDPAGVVLKAPFETLKSELRSQGLTLS